MKQKKRGKALLVRIPEQLHFEVQALLLDYKYGKIAYGSLSSLVTRLLKEWVDKQRVRFSESSEEELREQVEFRTPVPVEVEE